MEETPLPVLLATVFITVVMPGLIAVTFERSDQTVGRRAFALIFLGVVVGHCLLVKLSIAYPTEAVGLSLGFYSILANLVLVVLAVRRLRDAAWAKWPAYLGAFPPVNLLLFLLLSVIPGRRKKPEPAL